jgi:hypothetical protein
MPYTPREVLARLKRAGFEEVGQNCNAPGRYFTGHSSKNLETGSHYRRGIKGALAILFIALFAVNMPTGKHLSIIICQLPMAISITNNH